MMTSKSNGLYTVSKFVVRRVSRRQGLHSDPTEEESGGANHVVGEGKNSEFYYIRYGNVTFYFIFLSSFLVNP